MVYYKLFYKYIKYVMFYLLLFCLLTKKKQCILCSFKNKDNKNNYKTKV